MRFLEARLAGFDWKPFRRHAARGESETATHPGWQIIDAANRIVRSAAAHPANASQHDAGVAWLLTQEPGKAIALLGEAADKTKSAAAWSDLAAAKHVLAAKTDSLELLVGALVAADTALRINSKFAEARFNRALILEDIGLRELAGAAWRSYLDIDSTTQWAMEARAHERDLSKPPPQFREELDRCYKTIAGKPALAAELARRFPQEVRTWGETEILARWADAEMKSDPGAAAHLAVARAFGEQVAQRGDTMLQEAVRAIESASTLKHVLAQAHLDFRLAQQEFRQMKPAAAEPIFARAARDFERGQSPMALLAHYFRANTIYEQGRVEEALTALERLHVSASPRFRSCRAQIEWEIALCHWAKARWGKAIDYYTASMTGFESLNERAHTGAMRHMLAGIHDSIGDTETAWKLRRVALRQLGLVNSTRLQAALGSLATAAILRRDWSGARSVLNLELESARAAGSIVFQADALLRRALVLHRSGDDAAARDAGAEAKAQANLIEDPAVRTQYDGRLLWVDGALAESAAERIDILTRAIAFHQQSGRRMLLPSVFHERALAHRAAGNTDLAAADLESAIMELESHRSTLAAGERRWGIFHASEDIFEAAIGLSIDSGDDERAFRYADRARATTLLDALRTRVPSEMLVVPDGYTIIEYSAGLERLRIFVADQNGVRRFEAAVGRTALAGEVRQLHEDIGKLDDDAVLRSLHRLYKLLMQPVEPWITPNHTLVIVPDATVSSIPFAALANEQSKFLVERHPILISPSAALFLETTAPRHDHHNRLLMVVNADVPGWQPLREATKEAAAISSMYRDFTLIEGPRATAEALAREANDADTIHFSGHALASEVTADETFLLLSGAQGTEEHYDVRRIAAMHLSHAPVVVLAACSTARGPVAPFEGTLSAARSFLAAGASNVIATLWPIDDEGASTFYALLHSRLARGDEPAKALQWAQIESIRQSAAPSMWAAVQSIGK